ncbi:septum formation initiator family protein [Boudabousia liubingyangii]|uniref:Septum formation initiator family protein n=1 Tax=Boudabousia liubingyangii TaxID=1921764 RepID=A0A1Q5PJT6_9ACTO|nr:DUF501 domain-containing protein [Boudabousia liubingyangii]OKL46196.1 septum formation initiator family protein [Boudabousia liubingyangii]OKL46345.1 septum formation initiator family protein [Boudabousia liubingyangii]
MNHQVTETDLAALENQLGRVPRGVIEIAARNRQGEPLVVTTRPRLEDGTPFPTTFYLTHPGPVKACSTLEARHLMDEMQALIQQDEAWKSAYAKAHQAYIDARSKFGEVPEISGVSAGGMPERVKCLHALVGHALAAGPGVNPVGDWALKLMTIFELWEAPEAYQEVEVPEGLLASAKAALQPGAEL